MKTKVVDIKGYDDWKTGGSNPGNQCADGPCGFCEGEGRVESEDELLTLCSHCEGFGECGCLDCREELLSKEDHDEDYSNETTYFKD